LRRPTRRLSLALLLFTLLVAVACDRWVRVAIRNDGEQPLRVVFSYVGGQESRLKSPLAPGVTTTDVGFIAGPPDRPLAIKVKAYDASDVLVYCRVFTGDEYKVTSAQNPVSLKPGDVRCG
jgi:hypothetical protein